MQAAGKIRLENLQCRKNEILGDEIQGVFQKLRLNKDLRVLNLSDNKITNAIAEEIRDEYVCKNVFIEEIGLLVNKSLHSQIEENIDDECRKNLLI